MSDQLIVVLGAIGLIVVVLAVTAIRWGRSRSVRALLHGIGLALIIGALWIVGFLDLVLAWVRATVRWVRQTPFDTVRLVGACIGGAGLLVLIIGSAMSPVSRAEARQRREKLRAAQTASSPAPVPGPANPGVGTSVEPAAKSATATATPPSDSDDAEIEEILRRRGIK
ncbi:MAG: hypothetical protein M0Z51_00565 [Propionibacterium sp.]|nr:hypothetical protein [Propionibacterium sp.]